MLMSSGPGASVLLLGPSGSGKTFLRQVAIDHARRDFEAAKESVVKGLWRRATESTKEMDKSDGDERTENPKSTVLKMVIAMKSVGKRESMRQKSGSRSRSDSVSGSAGGNVTEPQIFFPQSVGLAELFGSFVRVTHNLEAGGARSAKSSVNGSALAAERARKAADADKKAAEMATTHRRGGLKNAEDVKSAVKDMELADEGEEGGESSEEEAAHETEEEETSRTVLDTASSERVVSLRGCVA